MVCFITKLNLALLLGHPMFMAGHQHKPPTVRDTGTDPNLYELKILHHNEDNNLNNLSKQGVSGTSVSNNNLVKSSSVTSINGCGVNILPINNIVTVTNFQNVTTKVPSQENQSTIKMYLHLRHKHL
jgi:hypothetical protein